MTREKKSERLEIRLGYTEKQDFSNACDSQGDTPSGALRRFISGYVRRADTDMMSEANRRLRRRYGGLTVGLVLLSGIAIAGLMAWTLGSGDVISDDQIFTARDVDGDGELSLEEHKLLNEPDGRPNAVMKVLDLDASGTLSASEFQASGRMVFMANVSDTQTIMHEGKPVPMTMVDFQFTAERTRYSVYADATVNAGELDRVVVWYDDGRNGVFEGDVGVATGPDGKLEFFAETMTFPSSVTVSDNDDGTVTASGGQKETAPEGGR